MFRSDQASAVAKLIDWLGERRGDGAFTAIGHRVVHGGPKYWEPQRITPQLIRDLNDLVSYDPEHLLEELQLVEAFQRRFLNMPQFACFDTAFHHDLPRVAQQLAIPRRYEMMGVRRNGFHGLSYAYLMQALERLAGAQAASGSFSLTSAAVRARRRFIRGGASTPPWHSRPPQAS